MNISHEWLGRFVPHGRTPAEVRDLLTAHVATVEGFEPRRADLAPFVVGRVLESERIPETKLSFNKVDDGSGTPLEVVCGAPNVQVGAKYPFARTGTVMPGGLVIEKRKIRGFTSNGMLCSARELGLGEDHEGILTLTTEAAPGTPLLSVLPTGDVRLIVDVLPNRPDLLSHLGVAREVAALTGVPLRRPTEIEGLPPLPRTVERGEGEARGAGVIVTIEERADCPQYGIAAISGLKVGPSPAWLKASVESIGGRSINNIVDATNYLLHGFGQPMHAFDADRIANGTIGVRRSRTGEKLVTLDGVERLLAPGMLVIADAAGPTALAGVMGGRASEVSDATTRVLLEVAEFAPRPVRATRRGVGLSTDASYRFERGIDGAAVPEMLALGAALIAHVGGGAVDALIHVGESVSASGAVTLRPSRASQLLGDPVDGDEITRLLRSIGFAVRAGAPGSLVVTAPSWRLDVSHEVDLIEEIARLRGFDRLPDDLKSARPGSVRDHPLFTMYLALREFLVGEGLFEARPLPFTAGPGDLVRVQNPLGDDEPYLRGSVLDSLARRAEYNLNRMQGNVRLFEVGAVFAPRVGQLPIESQQVGVLLMGAERPPHFTEPQPPAFDAWDAKALAERMLTLAFSDAKHEMVPAAAESGDLWVIHVDGAPRGVVRRLPLDAPVWAKPAFGIELTLGVVSNEPVAARGAHAHHAPLASPMARPVRFRPLPTTPAAEFDLALLVAETTPAAEVERVLRESAGAQLEQCLLFDEFRGTGVPAGMRSLAWRLTFRHPDRTLRDKEIDGRRSQILKSLEGQLGVRPRSS